MKCNIQIRQTLSFQRHLTMLRECKSISKTFNTNEDQNQPLDRPEIVKTNDQNQSLHRPEFHFKVLWLKKESMFGKTGIM